MLPVTIGLGLINFNLLINSTLGSLVSDDAPRAIDAAFRIYMLPAGHVQRRDRDGAVPGAQPLRRPPATTTACARSSANGMRQVFLLLIPAAAATLALSTPITRLIYQHGAFGPSSTDLVSTALFWFSFSLPFSRRQPAADADVLQPAAAVDHDGHRGPEPRRERRRLGRALQAVRHRRASSSAPAVSSAPR